MKTTIVDQARERLVAIYPGREIGQGKILAAEPHPLIQFTIGEEVVTVRQVALEVTRRAVRVIRADMKRRQEAKVGVVKLLQAGRNRRG